MDSWLIAAFIYQDSLSLIRLSCDDSVIIRRFSIRRLGWCKCVTSAFDGSKFVLNMAFIQLCNQIEKIFTSNIIQIDDNKDSVCIEMTKNEYKSILHQVKEVKNTKPRDEDSSNNRSMLDLCAVSKLSGLSFNVAEIHSFACKKNFKSPFKLELKQSIYISAVLEYLCAELLELGGIAAKDNKSEIILPRHVQIAIASDDELSPLFLEQFNEFDLHYQ